jgi:hypothetical protein
MLQDLCLSLLLLGGLTEMHCIQRSNITSKRLQHKGCHGVADISGGA